MLGNLGPDYKKEELKAIAAAEAAALANINTDGGKYKLTETFDAIGDTLSNVRNYMIRGPALAAQMIDDVVGHDREEALRRDAEAEEKLRSGTGFQSWLHNTIFPTEPDATARTVQQLADDSGYDPRAINTAVTAGMMILPGAGRSAVRRAARYADDFTALAGGTGMGTGAGGNLFATSRGQLKAAQSLRISEGNVRLKPKGTIYDTQGRRVEAHTAKNLSAATLSGRDRHTALATNYDISNQRLYQQRYGQSRAVKAQGHHSQDHGFVAKAVNRPDRDVILKKVNQNFVRTGNDPFNMVDAWGTERMYNILGRDHQYYLHNVLYPQLPTRRFINQLIENGSWNRYSPSFAASMITKAAYETEAIVLKWAKWKLGEIKKLPGAESLKGKKLRRWMEQNEKAVAEAGSSNQPTFEQLNLMRKVDLNDDLKNAFGIEFGRRTLGGKRHRIPLKHRRDKNYKPTTY